MSADTRPDDQRIDMGALLGALLSRWLRVLVVTILALGTTFAILQFVPRLYESTASILVEQRSNAATRAPGEQPSSQPTIPVEAMMSSQIELIKSRDTLLTVIDSENLRSEAEFTGVGFNPVAFVMQLLGRKAEARSVDETVLQNLIEGLTVVRERDSAVISVSVRSANPELAARLANAIANAHVQRRTALSLSDTAEASAWLEQEIATLRVKVEEAERAVADYRVDNDLFEGANNTSVLDTQLSSIATQITAAQERKNTALSRANLIRELLDAGQPIDGVEDVRNSLAIQQLTQTRANLQGELAQRSSTLLGNHPTIRALRAQIAEIEGQIAREGRRVATALEAEAEIEGSVEARLRDDLTRLKLSVSTATRDTVTLGSLEREAKAQRDLLEAYLLRYSDAASRTNAGSALPDVRVITLAAPAVSPASPKTALVLGAVGFVALALQIGGILFGELMSGRALTDGRHFARVGRDEDEAAEALEEEPAAIADLFDAPDREPRDEPETYGESELEPDGEDLAVEEPAAGPADEDGDPASADASDDVAWTEPAAPAGATYEPIPAYRDQFVPETPLPRLTVPVTPARPDPAVGDDDEMPEPAIAEGVSSPAAAWALAEMPPRLASAPAPQREQSAPVAEPAAPAAPTRQPLEARPDPAAGENALELSNLSADIALGRVRVVMLTALSSNRDCEIVADVLINDALRRGLSVALIDAGSARLSTEPGLTDLAADTATFGDVVHRVRDGLASVPWGHQSTLERRSMRPITLIEALSEIYEVVVVMTGRIGASSSLPVFAGVPSRLVLVGATRPDRAAIEAAVEDAANLGFEIDQIVHSQRQTEVA
jgi:succinoglycan biosynthesis transport protein ExoP